MQGTISCPIACHEASELALLWAKKQGITDPEVLRCEHNLRGTWTVRLGRDNTTITAVAMSSRIDLHELGHPAT